MEGICYFAKGFQLLSPGLICSISHPALSKLRAVMLPAVVSVSLPPPADLKSMQRKALCWCWGTGAAAPLGADAAVHGAHRSQWG